jgi:hypothetical protein
MISPAWSLLQLALLLLALPASAIPEIRTTSCPRGLTDVCNQLVSETYQCRDSSPWTLGGSSVSQNTRWAEFSEELQSAITNPVGINQGQEWLCGPAAFLYVFAVTSPDRYAQLATSLFCSGEWTDPVSNTKIDAHQSKLKDLLGVQSLFDFDRPALLGVRDWITEASLKTSNNLVFQPSNKASFDQLTFPGDMKDWLPLLGAKYKQVGSYVGFIGGALVGWPELSNKNAMKVVDSVKNSDGQVLAIALVGWDSKLPNHWVVLQKVIQSWAGDMCVVKTWGRLVWKSCAELMKNMYCAFILNFDGAIAKDRVEILQRDA